MESKAENQSLSLLIVNERSKSVDFVLEFWGEVYTMPPKATYTIIMEGRPQLGVPEIVIKDDQIIFYAPGGVAGIIHEGIELGPGIRRRPPS